MFCWPGSRYLRHNLFLAPWCREAHTHRGPRWPVRAPGDPRCSGWPTQVSQVHHSKPRKVIQITDTSWISEVILSLHWIRWEFSGSGLYLSGPWSLPLLPFRTQASAGPIPEMRIMHALHTKAVPMGSHFRGCQGLSVSPDLTSGF